MTSDAITRRLVAIVSADVAGYSRLMAVDELDTVQRLKHFRDVISDLAGHHGGRVVDNPGDNALLEFQTASGAVECALEIQETISRSNHEVANERRMEFRLGIHLREVLAEEDRIYGDGVNVAARLEAMAPVGGICISKAIRDQVVSRVDAELQDLGEHELKNIREPVHVYQVGSAVSRAFVSVGVALPRATASGQLNSTTATL